MTLSQKMTETKQWWEMTAWEASKTEKQRAKEAEERRLLAMEIRQMKMEMRETYPKLAKEFDEGSQEYGSYVSWSELAKVPHSRLQAYMEHVAVHKVLTSIGVDQMWETTARKVGAARRRVKKGDVLGAFEDGSLYAALS